MNIGLRTLVKAELAQILTPRLQGELARMFLAQVTGSDLVPDRSAGQPAPAADPAAAEAFITFSPVGVDHQTYVENLARAPAGSEQAREYQALVRHAGTTDPVAVVLIVGEVASNGVTNREAFARAGPLTGAELRYRIGADFTRIAAQARAEIVTLTDAIRNAEAHGATPADTAELRGLLQQSLNHFALVSEDPGALRVSGLVSDPIFSANLGVAEAYRSGGDALAARSVPGADGAYSTVEAATRMRAVIGPEAYDRYLDGAISFASLPFIPADVTASADIRTNIVRQLDAGFNLRKSGCRSAYRYGTPKLYYTGLRAFWANVSF